MVDFDRNLYLYWTGTDYKLIKILRYLINLHSNSGKGYNVHLITQSNLSDYINHIPDYFYSLKPAHQADLVRVCVLCDRGGIWLDSDTLVLDSLDSVFDLIELHQGFFILENNIKLWNGVFGTRKETPLMLEWKSKILSILDKKQNKITWNEIGGDLLRKIQNQNSDYFDNYKILNGLESVYPVNWDECESEFLDKDFDNYKKIIRKYQPFIALVNSVYHALESKSTKEIISGNLPINYFINLSIKNKKNYEQDTTQPAESKKKYVIVTDWLLNYLTQEHYKFAENLIQSGWNLVLVSQLENSIEEIKNQGAVILCVTYDDIDIEKLKTPNNFVIYKLDDIYPFKKIREECIKSSDLIISPYQYLLKDSEINSMYPSLKSKKTIWIPYSAVDEFFQDIDFNLDPIKKVLISGNVSDLYPFRKLMKNEKIIKNYHEKIDNLKHPGYVDYKHQIIKKDYYQKLNQYICCFVDSSIYKYVLLKVFEITSVGSLLLIDENIRDVLNHLGFEDNVNCIFCNKYNISEKIDWILDESNSEIINKIRKNGMQLTRSKHSTKLRSEYFNQRVESLF